MEQLGHGHSVQQCSQLTHRLHLLDFHCVDSVFFFCAQTKRTLKKFHSIQIDVDWFRLNAHRRRGAFFPIIILLARSKWKHIPKAKSRQTYAGNRFDRKNELMHSRAAFLLSRRMDHNWPSRRKRTTFARLFWRECSTNPNPLRY